MAHSIIYDQYTPGGPHSQITTVAAIVPSTLSQYAAGGVAEQMRVGVSGALVYNQRAAGGCAEQLRLAANALP
jgi:hypothetical protein